MKYSADSKRKIVAAIAEQYSGAEMRIFSGEPPATAEASAPVGELARLSFPSSIAGGESLVVTITDERAQLAGVPRWFRITGRDGKTIADGEIGKGKDIEMPEYIPIGARVIIENFTIEP